MYYLKIFGWCILVLAIGFLFGLFCKGIDNIIDVAFDRNSNLMFIAFSLIVLVALFVKFKNIYLQCKNSEIYRTKIIDEFKLMAIGLIFAFLLVFVYKCFSINL